ncbi:lipoyl amidotransferase LIPT1, mitochondrial isoform X2 [Anabrus simplex]|uniref:lipoyl amidotransferase LIPT1, mitochondrial isoform X2 n=1 Tax=Anabrus simplex TaxID=316456 RepID=UPI0035A2D595
MAQTLAQGTMSKLVRLAVGSFTNNSIAATVPCIRRVNNYSTEAPQDGNEKEIKKSVFISQSNDIFTNLALEDWLYRNFDFTDHHVLLMWRNSPCVVIGRHQNPWLEANTINLYHQGMELARRNSGGGTVYHDNGNLNFTFFTPRAQYNRRNNLEIITRALYREWAVQTEISPREDIVIQGNYKISGTAAKLGRPNAYHHCTLLVDINKVNLNQALRKVEKGIVTNATTSVPSPVMNLGEVNRNVKVELLLGAIGWEYLRTCPFTMEDGGQELISKQRGFQLVNPTEDWFPGLNKLRNEFQSWDWRYGKTPKFQVKRSFKVPQELIEETDVAEQELEICLDVNKGIIDDVTLTVPPGLKSTNGVHGEIRVVTSLRGRRFSEDAIITVENSLHDMRIQEDDMQREAARKNQFVMNCMKQVMKSA